MKNSYMEQMYREAGISPQVYAYGEAVWNSLKSRWEEIDAVSEYNQMKVIKAMQKNRSEKTGKRTGPDAQTR